jgi:uncharacterized protein
MDISKLSGIIFILLLIIFLGLVLLLFYRIYQQNNSKNKNLPYKTVITEINSRKYKMELANTNESRSKGLMFREKMDKDKGMLFIFERESIYPFWMKNTYIPLDMIWLNKNKEVVYIQKDVKPCKNSLEAICKSIVPTAKAMYVIELNTGQTDELDLKIGNKINFELE